MTVSIWDALKIEEPPSNIMESIEGLADEIIERFSAELKQTDDDVSADLEEGPCTELQHKRMVYLVALTAAFRAAIRAEICGQCVHDQFHDLGARCWKKWREEILPGGLTCTALTDRLDAVIVNTPMPSEDGGEHGPN